MERTGMTFRNESQKIAVLDVETANAGDKGSICSIGIVYMVGNRMTGSYYSLIRPLTAFSPQNIRIHGIRPEQVASAPSFAEFWAEQGENLKGCTLVAYNASFDIYAMERALYNAGIPIPNMRYACAMKLSRKLLGLEKYGLASVAEHLGIHFNHHNALEDAKAASAVLAELMRLYGASDLKGLMRRACLAFEYTLTNAYDPAQDKAASAAGYAEPKPLRFGTTSRFQGKSVVFTGNLCCAMRCEAQQAVAALGGSCKSTVSRKTDIVVFGLYDHDTLKPGASIGAKLEEAYTLVSQGYQIEILDENDFLEILYENLDA